MKRTKAESPRGWLGFVFGETDGRRLVVAFAVAIALHEIAAVLMPLLHNPPPPENVTAIKLTIEKKPTPSPKPSPTPHIHMLATVIHPRIVNSGASAQKEIIKHAGAARPKIVTKYHSKPIWDIPLGAHGNGAGKGGTYGSLGTGGTGTGSGTNGNGPGGGICGYVDFSNPHGSQYDKRTGGFFVDIRMTVHYADGHAEDLILDYPFYYPSEAANPFSEANIRDHPDDPINFQFPPANKRSSEPPIVQYVIQHTDPHGFTNLKDCPGA